MFSNGFLLVILLFLEINNSVLDLRGLAGTVSWLELNCSRLFFGGVMPSLPSCELGR